MTDQNRTVIPSEVEGSRGVILKLAQREPCFARDDGEENRARILWWHACRVRGRHSEGFRKQAAASTESDAEFLDPFDYAHGGVRSE
jgi:hypothetical protein